MRGRKQVSNSMGVARADLHPAAWHVLVAEYGGFYIMIIIIIIINLLYSFII